MHLESISWLLAPVKGSGGVQFLPQPSAQPCGLAILKVGFQRDCDSVSGIFFQPVTLKIDGGV